MRSLHVSAPAAVDVQPSHAETDLRIAALERSAAYRSVEQILGTDAESSK
jgi:hypothetical protein